MAKDSALRDLIVMELARQGKRRVDLAAALCVGYATLQKKLANPQLFTLAELNAITVFLNLNKSRVKDVIF